MEITTWDMLDVERGEVIEVNAQRYRFVGERWALGSRTIILNPTPPLPDWAESCPLRRFTQREDRIFEVAGV